MQRLTSVQPGLCLQVTFKAGKVTSIYASVPRPKRSAPRRQLAPLRGLPEKDPVEDRTSSQGSPADNSTAQESTLSPSRWQVPWGAGLVAQLMVQIWLLDFISVPLLTQLRGLSFADTSSFDKAATAAAVQLLKLLGGILFVRRAVKPYKPLPAKWFRYELSAEAIGLGVSGGVTALLLILLAAAAAGGSAGQNTGVVRTLLEGNRTGTIVAIATASLIGAPALEELVYRGFLLPSLTKWMPTPAAVLLQAVIFAGSHLSPGDVVPLTALGLSLGVVTVAAEGNLVAPSIAHALYNAVILYNVVKR